MALGSGGGGGGQAGGIRAGAAYVELFVKGNISGALLDAEKKFNAVGKRLIGVRVGRGLQDAQSMTQDPEFIINRSEFHSSEEESSIGTHRDFMWGIIMGYFLGKYVRAYV